MIVAIRRVVAKLKKKLQRDTDVIATIRGIGRVEVLLKDVILRILLDVMGVREKNAVLVIVMDID